MDAVQWERRPRNPVRRAWIIAISGLGVIALVVAVALGASAWINTNEPDTASDSVARAVSPGVPPGVSFDPMSSSPAATWVERGESFAVVTWGSGSCPQVAIAMTAVDDDQIDVVFGLSPNDPCTADMAPTTHEFDLPGRIEGGPILINVSYTDWPEVHTLPLD